MDDTLRFKEGLAAVISMAKLSDNHVTKAQVESCFKGIHLNEEQWELVFNYLELSKITIDDYTPNDLYSELFADLKEDEPLDLSAQDEKIYEMYLDELEFIEELTEAEELLLVDRMLGGDASVKDRLIEGRLKKVVQMAKRYAGKGVSLSDIIQEGNVALMMAVAGFAGGDYDAWVNSEIEEAFKAVVMEQEGHTNAGNYLAAEANALMEATAQAAEELGREATLEELASRMNLPEETVRDIMKVSMDALDMAEAAGSGETYGQTDEVSDEDREYFKAAYEDGEVRGDGWRAVSSKDMAEYEAYSKGTAFDEEPDTSEFMDWLNEDDFAEDADFSDEDDSYDDVDGNSLETGWDI